MNITKHWDWWTLILYIIVAVLVSILFRQSIVDKNKKKKITFLKLKFERKYLYYAIIYIFLILFSVFRYIDVGIGGTDTLNYINYFNNIKYIHFDILRFIQFRGEEYLFYNSMILIRNLGGNFRVFLFIIYSIMISLYIYMVDKCFKDKKKWMWIILFFIPFLKSFNIVRNCFTASIGYFAIEKLNNKKIFLYITLSIICFLCHSISIILPAFLIFYLVIPDKVFESRNRTIIMLISSLVATGVILPIAKMLLANSGFAKYLSMIQISLTGYVPYFAILILLLYKQDEIIKYLKEINHYIYYKVFIFICMILPFFICVNGAYRILIFFDIPRFILYSDLYMFYRNKIKKKFILAYDILVGLGIVLWYAFRIYRMWRGYSLMPYYNILLFK